MSGPKVCLTILVRYMYLIRMSHTYGTVPVYTQRGPHACPCELQASLRVLLHGMQHAVALAPNPVAGRQQSGQPAIWHCSRQDENGASEAACASPCYALQQLGFGNCTLKNENTRKEVVLSHGRHYSLQNNSVQTHHKLPPLLQPPLVMVEWPVCLALQRVAALQTPTITTTKTTENVS